MADISTQGSDMRGRAEQCLARHASRPQALSACPCPLDEQDAGAELSGRVRSDETCAAAAHDDEVPHEAIGPVRHLLSLATMTPPAIRGYRLVVGLWRMSRPEQVLLILVVFAVGAAAGAVRVGSVDLRAVVWAAAALVPTALSVHFVNEYADAETDAMTTRTAFSGGSGALTDLGLTRTVPGVAAVVMAAAALAVLAAGAAGAAGAGAINGLVAVLLVVGLVGGWSYSVGPWPLSRHGTGEVANALLGGLLLPVFGVAAATGTVTIRDVLIFVPFALLVFVNLLETQWADRDADRITGKLTLAVRLRPPMARGVALAVTAVAYGVIAALAVLGLGSGDEGGSVPWAWAVAALPALPLSVWAAVSLARRPPLPAVLAIVTLLIGQGGVWVVLAASR